MQKLSSVIGVLIAVLIVAWMISGVAHCQTFEIASARNTWEALYQISRAQSSSPASPPSAARGEGVGATSPSAPSPASRLTVAVSRQSLAVLRSVTGTTPEGASLYSVRVCANVATQLDQGIIEQALVASGISISPRGLAQLAVTRSRSKKSIAFWRALDIVGYVAPAVIGFAASGSIKLEAYQIALISGFGSAVRIAQDAAKPERDRAGESITGLGLWLSDMPAMSLEAGRCTASLLVLGNYSKSFTAGVLEIQ